MKKLLMVAMAVSALTGCTSYSDNSKAYEQEFVTKCMDTTTETKETCGEAYIAYFEHAMKSPGMSFRMGFMKHEDALNLAIKTGMKEIKS